VIGSYAWHLAFMNAYGPQQAAIGAHPALKIVPVTRPGSITESELYHDCQMDEMMARIPKITCPFLWPS